MHSPGSAPLRFGVFEVDVGRAELRRQGLRVRIHDQPFQLLLALLERPGGIVTRQELQHRLWPDDTFVEFDNSLNNAIRRLREALGDSAENPRFIETVPRRGYRFIAPVSRVDRDASTTPPIAASRSSGEFPSVVRNAWWGLRDGGRRRAVIGIVAAAVLTAGLTGGSYLRRRASADRRGAAGTIGSLAVLPFRNLSGDPQQEYFADGMTEALTLELSRIRRLRVTSATSAMHYKQAGKPAPLVANELGVDALVEGSVQREGSRVRVTVQVIAAAADAHVWSNSYERELASVLTLHQDLARAIAAEIRMTVAAGESIGRSAVRPVDPDAYLEYLRGRQLLFRRTEPELRRALDHFERVVARDPDFAPAHLAIASAWDIMASWGLYVPPKEGFPQVQAAAKRALEIDDSLGEAHMRLAFAEEVYEWRPDAAAALYQRALALGPSDALTHHRYALHLSRTGRPQEALEAARRAHALDPMSQDINIQLASQLQAHGRRDEALAQMERARDIDPSYFDSWVHLSYVYEVLKRPGDQLAAARKGVELSGAAPHALHAMARAYVVTGDRAQARVLAEELERRTRQRNPFELAILWLQLEQRDRGLLWLHRACEERAAQMAFFRRSNAWPIFNAVRADRRFAEILKCAGVATAAGGL